MLRFFWSPVTTFCIHRDGTALLNSRQFSSHLGVFRWLPLGWFPRGPLFLSEERAPKNHQMWLVGHEPPMKRVVIYWSTVCLQPVFITNSCNSLHLNGLSQVIADRSRFLNKLLPALCVAIKCPMGKPGGLTSFWFDSKQAMKVNRACCKGSHRSRTWINGWLPLGFTSLPPSFGCSTHRNLFASDPLMLVASELLNGFTGLQEMFFRDLWGTKMTQEQWYTTLNYEVMFNQCSLGG